ncbi:MAG: ATP-binding cassette domain-containing protein [Acidobacteriota bacterium]
MSPADDAPHPSPDQPLVRARGVGLTRTAPVFGGLELDLATGECLALVGPNGAGKTSLLELLAGLRPPTSGKIEVLGESPFPSPPAGVELVATTPALHPDLTLRESLLLRARLAGLDRDETDRRVRLLLHELGLASAADRLAPETSTGQRRRAALAQALLSRPRLLLLDEPESGLDPTGVDWLGTVLDRLVASGCGVIVSSHRPGGLSERTDRTLELSPP